MKTLPFCKIRNLIIVSALLILTGGAGYRLGEQKVSLTVTPENKVVVNREPPAQLNIDFSLFWDVWQRLLRYYYDAATLEPRKMVEGAIIGMVNSLGDPYTAYLPPKENKEFKEELGGAFEGIGAQLGIKDNRIVVIAPLAGMPAEKVGIKAGDWIIKVNDEETVGWTLPQAISNIRGPKGTQVKLTILHEKANKPLEITITRDTITVPSVVSWIKTPSEITEIKDYLDNKLLAGPGKIAYIGLTRFGDHSNDDWLAAVGQIEQAQRLNGRLKGLIFDLRNNPGGYLEGSVFIASEFLKNGIIVTQKNSDGSQNDYEVNRKGKLLEIPLVVLINKGSASAAEIVAGTLKDYKRATIVGEISFGKGSVQTPQELSGGGSLHVTTAKWFLPKGDSINKTGITPDILVSMEENGATRDAQLAKAVEILLR